MQAYHHADAARAKWDGGPHRDPMTPIKGGQ
jgi:hypothetical protein